MNKPGQETATIIKSIATVLTLMVLTSCVPAARAPVDTISYPFQEGVRQECLIIFLPGRGDRAADFERHDFIDMARQYGPKADLLAADLHFGYFLNRTALERLRYDVIAPARDQGYRCIWLIGISLGGFEALNYQTRYPGETTGIVLFAPYLGGDRIIDEVFRAGGVAAWQPGNIAESDYERQLWAWIKTYKLNRSSKPFIYLGYGEEDRFLKADNVLAGELETDHIIAKPGGHTWSAWIKLWKYFLGERIFSRP